MTNNRWTKYQYGNREKLKAIAVSVLFVFAALSLSAQSPPAPYPDTSSIATGVTNLATTGIKMWSTGNKVNVDLTSESRVEATITLYQLTGQLISEEKFTNNSIYTRQIENIMAGYVVVSVRTDGRVFNRTLFIANSK